MFRYFIISLVFSVLITYGQGETDATGSIDTVVVETDNSTPKSLNEMSTGVQVSGGSTNTQGGTNPDGSTNTQGGTNPDGSTNTQGGTNPDGSTNTQGGTNPGGSTTTPSTSTTTTYAGTHASDSSTSTTTSSTTTNDRTNPSDPNTISTASSINTHAATGSSDSSSTAEPNTVTMTSFTSQAITTMTTVAPPRLLFSCNFNDTCFEGALNSTDGTKFNTNETDVPPPAPTSDFSSSNSSTVDNKTCQFPFQPSIGKEKANWSVSFCYNGECLTNDNTTSQCRSGRYGLLSLNASESNKTISETISLNSILRSGSRRGRVSYYYFFTVYNQSDWGQKMSIWIKSDGSETLIDNKTVAQMTDNKWYSGNSYFPLPASNFTLSIRFEVTNRNSSDPIYFALDDIMVYDEPGPDVITTVMPPIVEASSEKNLGLILGLSLGLGIPALLGVGLGAAHYMKTRKKTDRYYPDEYEIDEDGGRNQETGYSYATTSF